MAASQSKSDSDTRSVTSAIGDTLIESRGGDVVNIPGARRKVRVHVDRSGVQARELQQIINTINRGATGLVGDVITSQQRTTQALSNIAQSTTGTQSEFGRIADKAMLPLIFVATAGIGLVAYNTSKRGKR